MPKSQVATEDRDDQIDHVLLEQSSRARVDMGLRYARPDRDCCRAVRFAVVRTVQQQSRRLVAPAATTTSAQSIVRRQIRPSSRTATSATPVTRPV